MMSMNNSGIVHFLTALLLSGGSALAIEISGSISSTQIISEDSQLVGNVTCTVTDGPCISIVGSDLRFKLNGFTITGQANPPAECVATTNFLPVDGISIIGRRNVAVLGPGIVQRFRRHGVFVGAGSSRISVRQVTSSHNCFSGLQLSGAVESNIEDNILVRNASASAEFPCGGNCITNAHANVIRRNLVGGNGFVGEPNNDFGIGLVGTSSNNEIEENTVVGNTNGILMQAGVRNNVLRRNIIVGNPPVQLNVTFGAFGGADIQNLAPSDANWIDENICVSYVGSGNSPCSYLRRLSGGVGVNSIGTLPVGLGWR